MPGFAVTGRSGRWGALVALSCGRMCMGLQLQSVAALTPFLVADLGLSYSQIGLLIGLFLFPGIFLGLPGTLLGARFGYRLVGVTGVVLMAGGGAILAASHGFGVAVAGRIVAGIGGILVNITFIRLVAELFEGRAMTRALSVLMCSWPIGLAVAALTLPWIAVHTGWRTPLLALSLMTLLVAALIRAITPEPRGSDTGVVALSWRPRLDRRDWRLSTLAGGAWAAFTAAGVIFLSFAPTYLMDHGMAVAAAGAVASPVVWLGVVAIPLGGWLADRADCARGVIVGGTAVSVGAILMLPLAGVPLVWTVLLGMAWGVPAAPYMAMLQRALAPSARAGGYGMYFTLFYTGFFGFPAVAGWLKDVTGSSAAPLYFAAALLAATIPALLAFYRGAASPAEPAEPIELRMDDSHERTA